jgi:hypothetical protein
MIERICRIDGKPRQRTDDNSDIAQPSFFGSEAVYAGIDITVRAKEGEDHGEVESCVYAEHKRQRL